MSFSLFRRKSRLIYIVTSIVLIPAFILLYGNHAPSTSRQGANDREIGRIDGKPVYASAQYAFHQNMGRILSRGRGLRYLSQGLRSLTGGKNRELFFLLAYGDGAVDFMLSRVALQEAEKYGLAVSSVEVGNYIRTNMMQFRFRDEKTGKFSEAQYRKVLKDQYQTTPREYQEGVRQWLLLSRFFDFINQTSLGTWETAYQAYAQETAEYRYYKLHVRVTDAMKKQALDTLRGVSKDNPKGDDAFVMPAVERYLAKHQDDRDRRFWKNPKWRFEYVFAAKENANTKAEAVSDEALQKYFTEQGLFKYPKKKLAEIREQVLKDYLEHRKDIIAKRLIVHTFESRINKLLMQVKDGKITLDALLNDRTLKQRGLQGGVSSPEAITLKELRAHPALGNSPSLAQYLDSLDAEIRSAKKADDRAKIMERAQKEFDNQSSPMASKAGYFRIRILDYIPGEKRTLKDAKGNVDQGLRLEIVVELQREGALKLAREAAANYGERLKTGKTEGISGLELLSTKFFFLDQDRAVAGLRDAELLTPLILPRDSGFDVLMLVERKMPSRAAFDALPQDQRLDAMRKAVTIGRFSFRGPPTPVTYQYGAVAPGARFYQWMSQVYQTRITFTPQKRDE